MRIAILDYGVGNLFSIKCALERLGVDAYITPYLEKGEFDGIILPGVGNFTHASRHLTQNAAYIDSIVNKGTPIFGICLGMQLLFEESEEGHGDGLKLLSGKVLKLPKGVKIPHIGWNRLKVKKSHKLVDGIEDNSWVYFAHSYYPKPNESSICIAEVSYGITFPVIVANKNIFGTQFHPEKSGEVGNQILRNFLELCRR
ncbi:MAG: imidazole glycerol phosphate synthase subunit HisH [Nitrososphaerales archaeon]|nr:imidazole glycerol phosphate synthase subunit HisH [Nitrososphaerales archaeon]